MTADTTSRSIFACEAWSDFGVSQVSEGEVTYAEFLKALEQTPRDWWMSKGGCIRRGPRSPHCECPITALRHRSAFGYRIVGQQIGLGERDISRVSDAADDPEYCVQSVRADLVRPFQ